MRPPRWRLAVLPCGALCLLCLATLVYQVARPLYMRVLAFMIIEPYRTPFFDLEYLFTANTCWRRGIDVYVANPCDQLNRPMGYSPLWLRMDFLAIDPGWSAPLGLALACLFCLSLAALPPPSRRWRDIAVIGLAGVSSLVLFAVERGNVDVIMYLFALCAALAAAGSWPVRLAGYGLLLLAGLLKFYPLAALLAVVRERLAPCLALAASVAAALVLFVVKFHDELHRMSANIPHGSMYGARFGAVHLPAGFAPTLRPVIAWLAGPAAGAAFATSPAAFLAGIVLPLLVGGAAVLCVAGQAEGRRAVAALPQRPAAQLLIGGALICGCFFIGQSIAYRGIMLLLVLPGVLCLASGRAAREVRIIAGMTIVAILIVMFRLAAYHVMSERGMLPTQSSFASLAWVAFELVWWWVAGALAGYVLCLVLASPAFADMRSLATLARAKLAHAAPPAS